MSQENCRKLLEELKMVINEVAFHKLKRNTEILKEMYNQVVEENMKGLTEVNSVYNDSMERLKALQQRHSNAKRSLEEEKMSFDLHKEKLEKLKRREVEEPLKVAESLNGIEKEILEKKKQLAFQKKLTGVRFAFDGPKEMVTGHVILDLDGRKVINPFMIRKDTTNITKELRNHVALANQL